MSRLAGVVPSLVTPFDGRGAVDLPALRRVARFAAASGAHGVMVCALAGEVVELDADERRRCLAAVVEEVGGDLPVFAGVGADRHALAQALARDAEQQGAACIVISMVDGRRWTPSALEDALAGVAGEVAISAMVQDAPAYLETEVGLDAVLSAARRAPNIRHVKREGGSLPVAQAIAHAGDELSFWGGDAGVHLLDCIRAGAVGAMPGVEAVDGLVKVYEHELAGRPEEADEGMRRLLPLLVYEMQSLTHYVACAKHMLHARGLVGSTDARTVNAVLSERSRKLLEGHARAAGLEFKEAAHPPVGGARIESEG
jgi:dihydrodipicolinate synthase/N-acetylneuraminate lyase